MDPRSKILGELFGNLSNHQRREEILKELYAPGIVFEDPLQHVEGMDAFREALFRMERKVKSVTVRLTSDAATGDALAVQWEMDYGLGFIPGKGKMLGVSWLTFDASGKCVHQRDYWDLAGLIEQFVPVLKPFLGMIRKLGA